MKIGIVFSCQNRMLGDVVRHALPSAVVENYDVGLLADPTTREAVAASFATCDHVLSIFMPEAMGPLATDRLAASVPVLTVLPSFSFAGFHPDMVYITTASGYLEGPTHHYHSRIAVAGFLTGRSVRQTAMLYNALVFGRLGYFETFANERALAVQMFAHFSIGIDPLFDRWMARGCFMHSLNHPKNWAFADLGLAMCRMAGLVDDRVAIDPDAIIDDLAMHAAHPVLPPLARRLGLEGSTLFKPGHPTQMNHLSLEDFVEKEYKAFEVAGRAELEAVPMVSNLLAILG